MSNTNKDTLAGAAGALGFLLAVGIGLGCYFLSSSIIEFKAMDRHVTVKGLSEREVAADLAIWPLTFQAAADNLPALYQNIEASRAAVVEFLKRQGLGGAELTSPAPRISDRQAQGYSNNQNQLRYAAESTLTVRTADVGLVKKAMAAASELVSRGVVLMYSYEYTPRFEYTLLNEIKPEMIAEATVNAREAATQFAKDSGSQVGPIRSASQGYFSINDRDPYTPEIKRIRGVTTIDFLLEN